MQYRYWEMKQKFKIHSSKHAFGKLTIDIKCFSSFQNIGITVYLFDRSRMVASLTSWFVPMRLFHDSLVYSMFSFLILICSVNIININYFYPFGFLEDTVNICLTKALRM